MMSMETPITPVKLAVMTPPDGSTDESSELKESSQQDLNGSKKLKETLVLRETLEKIEPSLMQPPPVTKDPPASQSQQDENHVEPNLTNNEKATAPQNPESFDWDNFEARYNQAMAGAKTKEEALLNEFQELSKFFGTWAATASEQDEDRALKRLKTRETFIQNAEQSLEQKKIHHAQVVEAFRNALAMLGGP